MAEVVEAPNRNELEEFLESEECICRGLDLDDFEFFEAIEEAIKFDKLVTDEPQARTGPWVLVRSVSGTSKTFETPPELFGKHIAQPEITKEKAIEVTKGRRAAFFQNERWQNTVFEDPLLFARIAIPREGLYGIAGVNRVPTYLVFKSGSEEEAKFIGVRRPFFGSKNKNYHFNAKILFRQSSSLEEAFEGN